MSGVEQLARVLWASGDKTVDFGGYSERDSRAIAEALIANPAPLLDALVEAGVLREATQLRTVDRVLFTERRYVSEWRPNA